MTVPHPTYEIEPLFCDVLKDSGEDLKVAKQTQSILAEHWYKHWETQNHQSVSSDPATTPFFLPGHKEITADFIENARDCHHFQAFGVRNPQHDTIRACIACQVWSGPVPIEVVDPSTFALGAIWGLSVPRQEFASTEEATRVAVSLIQAASLQLQRHDCKKALTLALDEQTKEWFHLAGFQSGNMLTLTLTENQTLKDTEKEQQTPFNVTQEDANSDSIVCDHWHKMWLDVGMPAESLKPSFQKDTLGFIDHARKTLQYKTLVAKSTESGKVLGSVSCQIWQGPFPQIVHSQYFQYGSIWAVYVDPMYRRQGIGKALMKETLQYLHGIGCDIAMLVAASSMGQSLYESLGFAPNNALVCDLTDPLPAEPKPNDVDARDLLSETSRSGHRDKKQQLSKELAMRLVREAGMKDPESETNLTALLSATLPQLNAVFENHDKKSRIITVVTEIQKRHEQEEKEQANRESRDDDQHKGFSCSYIDPEDNWFTQNKKRFGKGFDLKRLANDPEQLAQKFDKLSTYYDQWTVGNRSKVERFIVQSARHWISSMSSPSTGLRVLDVACGIGLQGQILRLCGYQGHLVGTDISAGMIERTMERGCYDQAFVANANQPFLVDTPSLKANDDDDKLFDVVICTGAMELLNQRQVLQNAASVLKGNPHEESSVAQQGGQLWVSFQLVDSCSSDPSNGNSSTAHQNVHGIAEQEAMKLLDETGFDVMTKEVVPDAFYTPSPMQDGSLLPVPYLFVLAQKKRAASSKP